MRELEIIFEEDAEPEPHELQTGLFLRKNGYIIKFLAPKNLPGVKTPDIIMNGIEWEIKSPVNAGSRTIEHALRSASKQSANVIVDLRRSRLPDIKLLRQVKHEAKRRTTITRLIVITKVGDLLDIK